jgi:anaerobic C4-dicarboxylate transporter
MTPSEFYLKYGFKITSPNGEDASPSVLDSISKLADNDPNFKENLKKGKYMPNHNGLRYERRRSKKNLSVFIIQICVVLILFSVILVRLLS